MPSGILLLSKMKKYIDKIKRLFQYNTLFQLFSSRLFVQATTILQSIISRLLGPEGKGEFTEAILYPTLVASLSMLGLYTGIVRISAKKNVSEYYNITQSVLYVTLITGTLGLVISYIINSYMFTQKYFLVTTQFYAVYALIYNINRGLSAINNGRGNMGIFSISSSILNPVFFLCILVLCILKKISIETLLLSLLFANFCSLAFLFYKRDREKGKKILSPFKMLRYSLRFSPSDFSEPLYAYYDKAIVAFILSSYDLGLYTIAYSAAGLINIVSSTFSIQLFSNVARGETRNLFAYMRINFITMFLISLCMCVLFPFIIPFVFGNEFKPSVIIAILLLPVCILQGQSFVIERAILAKGLPFVGVQAKTLTIVFFAGGAFLFKFLGISSLVTFAILLLCVQSIYLAYMHHRMKQVFADCRIFPNIKDIIILFRKIIRKITN